MNTSQHGFAVEVRTRPVPIRFESGPRGPVCCRAPRLVSRGFSGPNSGRRTAHGSETLKPTGGPPLVLGPLETTNPKKNDGSAFQRHEEVFGRLFRDGADVEI